MLLAAAAALASASARAAEQPQVAGGAASVELVLSDYHFTPSTLTLEAGKTYQLRLVNKGANDHEFLVGRGAHPVASGDQEPGFDDNFFEGIDVLTEFEGGAVGGEGLEEVEVEPGGTVTLTFTVPAKRRGQWEMACFEPGHYELGMKGTLIVR